MQQKGIYRGAMVEIGSEKERERERKREREREREREIFKNGLKTKTQVTNH